MYVYKLYNQKESLTTTYTLKGRKLCMMNNLITKSLIHVCGVFKFQMP